MSRAARLLLAGLLLALPCVAAHAEDSVAIRYLDGHPPPNRSTEWINLRIARHPAPPIVTPDKQAVDRFFEQVAAALAGNGVVKDWQLAIPDAPAIEITIEIDGRKLKLVSCHTLLEQRGNYLVTERGGQAVPDRELAAVLAKESEPFRRHRIAFETILRLTLERTRARLSPV